MNEQLAEAVRTYLAALERSAPVVEVYALRRILRELSMPPRDVPCSSPPCRGIKKVSEK